MRKTDTVGVRELRDHLSALLHEVAQGRTLRIQQRGNTIALLSPASDATEEDFEVLVQSGVVDGHGLGPFGLDNAPVVRGASVSDAVIEDRR